MIEKLKKGLTKSTQFEWPLLVIVLLLFSVPSYAADSGSTAGIPAFKVTDKQGTAVFPGDTANRSIRMVEVTTAAAGAANPGATAGIPAVKFTDENGVAVFPGDPDLDALRVTIVSGGGSGDVTAAATFGTDNSCIRSDGTGKGVQGSGATCTIDDSGNITATSYTAAGIVAGAVSMSELPANGSAFRKVLVPDALTDPLTMKFADALPTAGDVLTFGTPAADVSLMSFTSSSGTGNFIRATHLQSGAPISCIDAGANDTYTCGTNPALTALTDGMVLRFEPNTNNTGAATVNPDSLGATAIVDAAGTALADNMLVAGRKYDLTYDGVSYRLPQGSSFVTIAGTASDAQIPNLNILSTGLTASRCVETDGSSLLTVAAGACGSAAADLTEVQATAPITVTSGTGPIPVVACPTCQNTPSGGAQFSTTDTLIASTIGTTPTDFATTFTLPANHLVANKVVRVVPLFEFTSSSTPPTVILELRAGTTPIYSNIAFAPSVSATGRGMGLTFYIQGTAAAGASVNVITNPSMAALNASAVQNTVNQPVLLATNGALTLAMRITYGAATGGNSFTLIGFIVEYVN